MNEPAMKKTTPFMFAFLIFLFCFTALPLASADYFVRPSGNDLWGGSAESPWATIQYAVDNAPAGSTIIIMDGTFTENVEITQSVIIRSMDWLDNKENDSAVVVASDPTDSVFTISSPNVVIEGLSIHGANGHYTAAGILISGETNCTIANNICGISSGETNHFGISLQYASENTIANNTCSYNDFGIEMFHATENTLFYNALNENIFYGISVTYDSDNNIISSNNITNCPSGIRFFFGDENTVLGNSISGSGSYRIMLDLSDDNLIVLNDFSTSSATIYTSSGHSNYWKTPIEVNYFYNGKWRKGYVGNYYSDHDLTDTNGDGITDTDYDLPDDEPDDEYPMAAAFSNYKLLEYGLVAYYPFTGNADDECPSYDHDGSVTGAVLTTDRFNKTDRAYFFDGDNDYIQIQNNSVLNMSGAQTLSAWINPVSFGGRIISKRFGLNGFELLFNYTTPSNLDYSFNGTNKASTNLSGMEGQWIFVMATYDGSNARLYINGVEEANSGETETIVPNFANLRFGQYSGSLSSDFHGAIDEVRIYDRALSQEEITWLYNEGKAKINAGMFMLLFN